MKDFKPLKRQLDFLKENPDAYFIFYRRMDGYGWYLRMVKRLRRIGIIKNKESSVNKEYSDRMANKTNIEILNDMQVSIVVLNSLLEEDYDDEMYTLIYGVDELVKREMELNIKIAEEEVSKK